MSNPDSDFPMTPREALEMRLTALLMGELPAEEAAALKAQIAADPQLAALHGRLRKATELLREASALPEPAIVSPEPIRLSNERREKLLAHFKTNVSAEAGHSPAPITPLRKKRDWWWVPMSLAAAVVVMMGASILGLRQNKMVMESPDFTSSAPASAKPSEPINAFGGATVSPAAPAASDVARNPRRSEFQENVERTRKLFIEAQGFYDTGRYEMAKKRSEQILALDPNNLAARKMEQRINNKISDYSVSAYNETRSNAIKQADLAWQRPIRRFNDNGIESPEGATADTSRARSDAEDGTNAAMGDGSIKLNGVTIRADTKSGTFSGTLAGSSAAQIPVLGDIPILGNAAAGGGNTSVGQLTINGGASVLSGTNTYTGSTIVAAGNLTGTNVNNASQLAEAPKSMMERNATLEQKPAAGDFDTGIAMAPPEPGLAAKSNRLYESVDELILKSAGKAETAAKAMEPAAAAENASTPNIILDSSSLGTNPLTAGTSGRTSLSANAIDALMFKAVPGAPAPVPAPAAPASQGNAMEVTKLEKQLRDDRVDFKAEKKADVDAPLKAQSATPSPVPQPEVSTNANPFSTFSLNVSDVGFKLAAASLAQGRMPDPATVRSEEFLNAFNYRDPEPTGGAPLAFASEQARYPFAQNRDLLRLSVKTAAAGRQEGRPLNLVLLIDNSGSMERADRVGILHEALRVLGNQLEAQDKISVVTFARTPRLWASGVSGDQAEAAMARAVEVPPQGGTNLEAGLALAYETARKHYAVGSISRVVLITDGAANLGDVNPEKLKAMVESQRRLGIALDCFGIGWEGYDDSVLETLSRNGDGRYGFINTPEEATTGFAEQLAGALRVAASDVKVQVEFNPKRVTAYRQIGYAKHQLTKEQFRDNTVDAAEIGAAESGNALYVVEVNPRGEGDLATVRVRFKLPGTADYREHAWPVPFVSGNNVPALDQASASMRLAGTAAAFAEWLVGSPYAQEVTTDRLLGLINGLPTVYWPDPRPRDLETMIRKAKGVSGR